MNLAENLRRLRLDRGFTQSALAEALGVSDRAVSRWERGAASPDVTLLSRLAMVLETSADALLGIDPHRMQMEILRSTEDCTALLKQGRAENAVSLLREKSALYPNQPELMVYLAQALLALQTEDSAQEALALCRAADSRSPASSSPLRLSTAFGCKLMIAKALYQLGKSEQAAQLIEDEMPAIFVSRELLLPRFVPPERAMRIRRSNVQLLANYLTSTMMKLGQEDPAFSEAACAIHQALDGLM